LAALMQARRPHKDPQRDLFISADESALGIMAGEAHRVLKGT